ncbi:unnamed protein product, partial [marine sediment metagenome]
ELNFASAASALSGAHLFNHNYFIIGNSYNINTELSLEPSLLLKHVSGAPLQADININATYNKKFTFGFSYRTGDAVVVLIKVDATENIRIGYSYDVTISKLGSYSNGAHELLLGWGMDLYFRDSNPIPRY